MIVCHRSVLAGARRAVLAGAVVSVAIMMMPPPVGAASDQSTYASPASAAAALVAAARADDVAALERVLGPDGAKLVNSGDPVEDAKGRTMFVAAYDRGHRVETEGAGRSTLVIGAENWPFPIPIVQRGGRWLFDTAAGEQEIIDRRIGRNELSAIEVCRAYVDAQRDYARSLAGGSGIREYAQHFVSKTGTHDGLYWPAGAGEPESPIGPLVASARAEGYGGGNGNTGGERIPYHGYLYRILDRQGPSAPGGAYDYIADGHMIGGFALVAFPALWGSSGVMTFIVNQDGLVHQKDLGPDTAGIARAMTAYDPDQSWKPVH
jgi:hypothetical protein